VEVKASCSWSILGWEKPDGRGASEYMCPGGSPVESSAWSERWAGAVATLRKKRFRFTDQSLPRFTSSPRGLMCIAACCCCCCCCSTTACLSIYLYSYVANSTPGREVVGRHRVCMTSSNRQPGGACLLLKPWSARQSSSLALPWLCHPQHCHLPGAEC
jgi:hypothetical protein